MIFEETAHADGGIVTAEKTGFYVEKKQHPVRFWTRIRRAARARLVAFAMSIAQRTLPHLSRRRVVALARGMGALAAACDRNGSRVAAANLQILCGRKLSERRTRLLVRGCYVRAAQIALDCVWFGRDTRTRVDAWTRREAILDVTKLRPALVVAGHFGNWEMMLLMGGFLNVPMTAVVKHQWSSALTEHLNELRTTLGVKVVFADGALRPLLKTLKDGGVAGFLLDQYTAPHEGGGWVDFGGLPGCVSGAVALLSRRTGAPVWIVYPLARKDGRYEFRCAPTMQLAEGETDTAFTQRITNELVRIFKRYPSQWMLMYPRWMRIPPGVPAEGFPFYSKPLEKHP